MKYIFFIPFIIAATTAQAQIKDITPTRSDSYFYNNLWVDQKGGVFVNRNQIGGMSDLMYYNNESWYKVSLKNYLISTFLFNEELYILTERRSDDYRGIFKLRDDQNGWDSISTLSLNGSVSYIEMGPGKQLYARGHFKNDAGEYHWARYANDQWEQVPVTEGEDPNILFEKKWESSKVVDVNGNHYFYTAPLYPETQKRMVKWDGKSWQILGGDLDYGFSNIAATSNGYVYGINSKLQPGGVCVWNGVEWKTNICDLSTYDGSWFYSISSNDKDEVFIAGYAKKGSEYLIMKYKDGVWWEFATIPDGPISYMYYGNKNLYAVSDHGITRVPDDGTASITTQTNVVKTDVTPVDFYYKQVWDIYMDYQSNPPENALNLYVDMFNEEEGDEASKNISEGGYDEAIEINKKLEGYKQRIRDLNILEGKNILATEFLNFLIATTRWVGSWGVIFSCTIKDDNTCVDGETVDLAGYTDKLNELTNNMKNVEKLYKERNGL